MLVLGITCLSTPVGADPADTLDQVTVNAPKWSQRELSHVIIPRFVESHSAPTAAIGQITRWQLGVCPRVEGLKESYNQFVLQRIVAIARKVGAPTADVSRKCPVNIQIMFTPNAQGVLDHIDRHYPYLLGSSRTRHDTTITRPIQSWYTTGTRAMFGTQMPIRNMGGAPATTSSPNVEVPPSSGRVDVVPDAPYGGAAPGGLAGSHLGAGLRSELLYVLVIVDASKLSGVPLEALADYLAMVSLSRMTALDTCNELPSIIDLLSPRCIGRTPPAGLTAADSAFLTALYASALEMRLNVQQGELRDRMMEILQKKP